MAVIVTRANLLALDAATGELLSRYESDVEMYGPTLVNGTLYGHTLAGAVSAIDTATGDIIWRYETNGGLGLSPAVIGGGDVLVTSGWYLYSLNADSGGETLPNRRLNWWGRWWYVIYFGSSRQLPCTH